MPYIRFGSEEQLLRSIRSSLGFDSYPRVTAIAGSKIYPDIDILQISRVSGDQSRLTGYELKLMRFDKRSGGLGLDSLYKGIGQAFWYLRNGVHRAVLALGFHQNIPNDDMIESFQKGLWESREQLGRILGGYVSIGVFLYEGSSLQLEVEAKSDFYSSDDKTRFLSQALFQRKFTWDKRLKND